MYGECNLLEGIQILIAYSFMTLYGKSFENFGWTLHEASLWVLEAKNGRPLWAILDRSLMIWHIFPLVSEWVASVRKIWQKSRACKKGLFLQLYQRDLFCPRPHLCALFDNNTFWPKRAKNSWKNCKLKTTTFIAQISR